MTSLSDFEVREYQEKICKICIAKNSLIYLPTGSGKTFIALKVIKHFSEDFKKPINEGGKRSVFLVNTVCLGEQHTESINKILGVDTGCWTSKTKNTTWSKAKYLDEFNKNQVIVATAQLFLDAIKHSMISIEQINVLIFDEAHHGRKDHPYHELMKLFKHVDPKKRPRVIGLSAMLVGTESTLTVDNIEETLKALEATFESTIVTVNKINDYLNVLVHSTNPKESFVRYKKPLVQCEIEQEICERIGNIRYDLSCINVKSMTEINPASLKPTKSRRLKELSSLLEGVKNEMTDMGLFAAYLSLKAIKVQYELINKKPNQNSEFLQVVRKYINHVDELINDLDETFNFKDPTAEVIENNSSPKVQALLKLLMKMFSSKDRVKDLQCLIFVTRRYTAKCLYHLLKKYAEKNSKFPVIADFVVGINAELPESIDDVLHANSNKDALQKFRDKITNCICASSVLEEGMDLKMCNLVIMFDPPVTFREYFQTMGRARIRHSNYIVMLSDEKVDEFLEKRNKMDKINIELKKILIGKACDRQISDEEIEKERLEIWEPHITVEKALVNNVSSVALFNRFISPYADANKLWNRRNAPNSQSIAILKIPQVKSIKLGQSIIESDPFDDIRTAKQQAAFKACKMLHEKGYLDENLIPKQFV